MPFSMNQFLQNKKLILAVKLLLFCTLVYFPFFLKLDSLPLRMWDEARYAVNAYEMYHNKLFFVTHYNGIPDMWNTKPPLMLWLQAFFYSIFGVSELAVRLTSALAALFTTGIMILFATKYVKNYWYGLIAVLLLITSLGYVQSHVTRTGDTDSLLVLFTTSYCLFWFLFLKENKTKYLHLFFIALTLAFYSKGIQALLFIPAIGIFLFTEKKAIETLKNKWLYIDFILSLGAVLTYYLVREHYNPGYLNAVWENELGGRYLTTLEGHEHPFSFYFDLIIDTHFNEWYWLIPCGIFISFFIKDKLLKSITLYSALLVIVYWFLISSSQTKTGWYDAPILPFLSLIAATAIVWLFELIKNNSSIKQSLHFNCIPFLFLFLLFLHPYERVIYSVSFTKENSDYARSIHNISYFLKEALQSKRSMDGNYLCYNDEKSFLRFYLNLLIEKGQRTGFKNYKILHPGDTVTAWREEIKGYIEKQYAYETIEVKDNIKTYKILASFGKPINIKASNGLFLCADGSKNNLLIANRDAAYDWEQFSLLNVGKNKYALSTYKHTYLSAELDSKMEIAAMSLQLTASEKFELIALDTTHVAIKTNNNNYLSLDEKTGKIYADTNGIGKNERFEIILK